MRQLGDNRSIRDNGGAVATGARVPRRFAVLERGLSGFLGAGIRFAYSTGNGKGVDVPFDGRRRLRRVVGIFSGLGRRWVLFCVREGELFQWAKATSSIPGGV